MKPADVEQAFVAHLRDVTGAPWGTRVPADRPERFGVLSRTGGGARNVVQSDPTVLVEAWATDQGAAWELISGAYAALYGLPYSDDPLRFGVWVAAVRLTDPVNNPDAVTNTPRYHFIATPIVSLEEL